MCALLLWFLWGSGDAFSVFIHPDRRDEGGEVGREGKLEARLVLDRPRGGKREMAWFNGHPLGFYSTPAWSESNAFSWSRLSA